MNKPCRVLVTGAGSGVGQGIVKALRLGDLPVTVVAGDIAPLNAALYRADDAILIPRVEAPGALDGMIECLSKHRIDVVMIGSEFDLAFFSAHKEDIERRVGALVVVAPPGTVKIANDKWETAEFLRKAGLPYAQSCVPGSREEAFDIARDWGYPLMLKTRSGTSSRYVHVVRDAGELAERFPATPAPMLQRLVDLPSAELRNEYTCSVFKTPDGRLFGPFAARRTLRGGTSWHVEVAPYPEADALMLGIGRSLDFVGSLNVQMMAGPQGPVPFEINARFSGTTAIRAYFGFNEPAMALRAMYFGEALEPPVIRTGVALRYAEEVFIDGVTAAEMMPGRDKGKVLPWF